MLTFSPRAEIVPSGGDCVRFLALEGQRWVPCAITREALEFLSGSPLPQPENLLVIYRQKRDRIHVLANWKFSNIHIRGPRQVLLTMDDMRSSSQAENSNSHDHQRDGVALH